ncbi:MAG: T9SS type A sorting domain-containing protein [Gilvibacter sp.]
MKKRNLLTIIAVMMIGLWSTNAQEYLQMIEKGTFTVQEIIENAEAHFAIVGTDKGSGYKQFKRWEYNALRMQGDDGRLKSTEFYINELARFEAYLNESTEARLGGTTGNWEEEGPTSWDSYQGWNPGVGRITGFVVDPADNDHIVVGANTGGVWRTTDGGANWTPLMDYFSNLYVYSIALDPSDSSTYFAGSNNGRIYKSTDSGATWALLGTAGGTSVVNKILINPNNTDIMFASVQNQGIYRSTNGGVTWSDAIPSEIRGYDIEFKPGDTDVVYASGLNMYKSTNGGASFTQLAGFAFQPKMIGVTPADPDRVYVVEANNNIFGGFYRSYDEGATFTSVNHAGNNYFGYSTSASDSSGQAPRDMDIAVNPADADDVFIAGILAWRSTNAGTSFTCTSGWSLGEVATFNVGYCHADIDIMEYVNGKLYVGSDGGIFVANNPLGAINTSFYTDLTSGLGIRQFYKIGIAQSDPVIITGGAQDNGTSVLTAAGEWRDWLGADGMESFVDKLNSNEMYGTTQQGQLYRTINGGASIIFLNEPGPGFGNWVTPFEQDPNVDNTIYVGYNRVYKSINSGGSYTAVSQTFPSSLDEMKIAPSNSDVMWACWGAALYKTTDGGATTWPGVSGTAGNINSIAIHPNDENKVAIATSYGGARVYVTLDGGSTWLNYKKNLPDFEALSVVWDDTSVNGLYVGMNYGLFYIDDTFTDWQIYNTNLPNVIVNELEINNVNDRIYAGTYGRGAWSSPVYDNPLSVGDNSFEQLVQLYPNPAKNEVTLKWPSSSEVDLQVFDVNGRLLINLKDQFIENQFNLNIAKLSPGVHFVRLSSEGSTIVKKLIVN